MALGSVMKNHRRLVAKLLVLVLWNIEKCRHSVVADYGQRTTWRTSVPFIGALVAYFHLNLLMPHHNSSDDYDRSERPT